MGLCFDDNGKYLGWSNLFNYDNEATLEASEKLPMPKNVYYNVIDNVGNIDKIQQEYTKQMEDADEEYKKILEKRRDSLNKVINIDEYIDKIEKAETPQEKIQYYAELLNYLYKNTYNDGTRKAVNITYTNLKGKEVQEQLINHEATKIPKTYSADISKNFISSHIQYTVQDLVNMTRAYSPIDMEVFREASEFSDKGSKAEKLTLLNPACKFAMQYSNMTGKNVIGIAANGEKGSFMWHYYLNDVIRYGNSEDIENAKFSFTTNRLVGRANNKLGIGGIQVNHVVNGLPDMNFETLSPERKEEMQNIFSNRITDNLYVDLMISQVLSAATDNAKELILAKVNAGSKLAKMYLFMITMGYNINDIVAFMTSPVATFIDTLTEENVLNHWKMSPETAAKLLIDGIRDTNTGEIKPFLKKKYGGFKIEQIEALLEKLKIDMSSEEVIKDAKEFLNILEGANEFSNFGRLLGVNQGIKTSKIELQKFENFVKSIFQDRVDKATGLSTEDKKELKAFGELDVRKWFRDLEYRKQVSHLYNKVKKCINIFEIFQHINQFDAIRELYDATYVIDSESVIKNKAFNTIIQKEISRNPYISEKYQTNLLREIDNAFINKFITTQNFKIPLPSSSKLFSSDASLYNTTSGILTLNNRASIASFKYLMENYFLPMFKQGRVPTLNEKGEVVESQYPKLTTNKFIQSLKVGMDNSVSLIESDLDMNLINKSMIAQKKYQMYSYALQELGSIKILDSLSLTDMFALYNLITNKNKYGSRRMTTLFDKIVQNDNKSLINNYYKFLGDLDFNGNIRFDYESNASDNDDTLIINYKDTLIQAAPFVKSTVGQNDPYVLSQDNGILTLFERDAQGNYYPVRDYMPKIKGETDDKYQERLLNEKNYFVLGGQLSDMFAQKIKTIQELKDSDKIISYLQDFVRQGLLTIEKNCE